MTDAAPATDMTGMTAGLWFCSGHDWHGSWPLRGGWRASCTFDQPVRVETWQTWIYKQVCAAEPAALLRQPRDDIGTGELEKILLA